MNPLRTEDLNNNLNDLKLDNLRVREANGHESDESSSSSRESSDSEEQRFDDDEDDEMYEMSQVKGLFSDKQFNNVIEMFKHEAESNLFNIIDIVNKYKLDMISYIKLINFIRREVMLWIV